MKKISHIVMMGDSLSDRGTVDKAQLFGCIPMAWFAGLIGTSPKGRFTNGYVWADVISAFFANDFLIKELKAKYGYSNDDLADAIIAKEKGVTDSLSYDYNLDNDLYVTFEGRDFIRSYDEGGLSAYNYAWKPSSSITRFFSRIILSTLEKKREKLLAYDEENHVTELQKEQTLVIEWSGANDLITVNAEPSIAEVDRAIKERVKNIEVLLQKGYRNFVWFNLPDLSLTPRFQNKTGDSGEKARANAHQCVNYFNQELAKACEKFKTMFPHCYFDVFDINSVFVQAYSNPEKYGLDPAKLKQPFTTSPDFRILPNKTAPAKGYAFWDDIHPTADVHAILGNEFYKKYNPQFAFTEPEDNVNPVINVSSAQLQKAFCTRYADKLAKTHSGFFGHKKASLPYQTATLDEILQHAFTENGSDVREVLSELQWINKAGELNLRIPALEKAMAKLQAPELNAVTPIV
ncbi:SGNH/GDSL hydrolase family protein [Legionella saoudiensis]|uniref:SGNH/GDSL hydrolase family protein n=1 Tax=Legionella saoudiensis TaxID=1750561 RepID=UPI0007319443|nr:SGNH/GDSL hydrolase family protein [Legionella saoudiensis]